MVIALVRPAIIIAQQVWKRRQQIYRVITAQDQAIKTSFRGTRVSKAAQYGWRSGAAAGGLLGTFINNQADDSPGNAIQKIQPSAPSRPPYKTRYRQTGRDSSRYYRPYKSRYKPRCPSPRKRYRS